MADKLGKADDIIIPILGATGVGKSTFINDYFGREVAPATSSLQSCTANIEHYYIYQLPSKRRIVLVDTPGLNHTYEDESEILRRIAAWLASSYDEGVNIAGAIYLADISQKRMYGSTMIVLGIFQGICGVEFYSKIIMATTHWDTVPQGVAAQREQDMKDNFWEDILRQGATVKRIQNRPKDIHDIVNAIVSKHVSSESSSTRDLSPFAPTPSTKPLTIQSEPDQTAPQRLILLLGITGAGNSTFVNQYFGRSLAAVGVGLKSMTEEPYSYGPLGQRSCVVVDTPGFDNSISSDTETMSKIIEHLKRHKGDLRCNIVFLRGRENKISGSGHPLMRVFNVLSSKQPNHPNGLVTLISATNHPVKYASVSSLQDEPMANLFVPAPEICRRVAEKTSSFSLDELVSGLEEVLPSLPQREQSRRPGDSCCIQ